MSIPIIKVEGELPRGLKIGDLSIYTIEGREIYGVAPYYCPSLQEDKSCNLRRAKVFRKLNQPPDTILCGRVNVHFTTPTTEDETTILLECSVSPRLRRR